jgi:DNA (cytosine-5)-methyltransferase 1
MKKKIRVAELFAGVGGFRLGLEGWDGFSAISGYKKKINSNYEIVWSNQWEPSTKTQHASDVYSNRWGSVGHSNEDISTVPVEKIPAHDLLVGGFPCQDYSVATTLKNSKGLIGKKGVLWWSIHNIISTHVEPAKYLFLENVDRLINSPAQQRGRDFAIILQSLNDLGYAVEWRVINAADFGFPQRRRRIFILAYHNSTPLYKCLTKVKPLDWIYEDGVFAQSLPIMKPIESDLKSFKLVGDIVEISKNFNKNKSASPFLNSGLMIDGQVSSVKTAPSYDGDSLLLKHVLEVGKISKEFYIDSEMVDKWKYLKGAKKEVRIKADGFEYHYSEGGMVFPDDINKPSRTIITGEGGNSPSRFKHVIKTSKGLRRLTPIELERLNMFPDNHTELEGVSATKRAFFMGNALVVGVIERIGEILAKNISEK